MQGNDDDNNNGELECISLSSPRLLKAQSVSVCHDRKAVTHHNATKTLNECLVLL